MRSAGRDSCRKSTDGYAQAPPFQIAEKFSPAFLVLAAAFRNAKNFPIAFTIHSDDHQNRNRLNTPALGPLEPDTVHKTIRILLFQWAIAPFLHALKDLLIQVVDGTRTDTAAPERLRNVLDLTNGYTGKYISTNASSTELSLR